jgi:hypothetical protein
MRNLERQAERVHQDLRAELDRVRRSFKNELVLYEPPSQALVPPPTRDERAVRIRIERPGR